MLETRELTSNMTSFVLCGVWSGSETERDSKRVGGEKDRRKGWKER